MCVNDWRLGRLIRSNRIGGGTGATTIVLVPQSSVRIGLLITTFDELNLFNSPVSITDTNTGAQLIAVNAQNNQINMSIMTHGDLVQKALTITMASSGVAIVNVVEFILPEEVLAAGIERFYSEYGIMGM